MGGGSRGVYEQADLAAAGRHGIMRVGAGLEFYGVQRLKIG